MLFRPQRLAAMLVDAVPMNGSSTVSPTKLNIRMSRSASSMGNGAGWFLVDAPVKPCQICWNHSRCFSSEITLSTRVATDRLPITARLALHQDELDIVLDDGIRLVGLAKKARRSVLDLIHRIGNLVPNDRRQIIETDLPAMLLNRRMERHHRMPTVVLPPGKTYVTHNDDKPTTRYQRPETRFPHSVQLCQESVVIG